MNGTWKTLGIVAVLILIAMVLLGQWKLRSGSAVPSGSAATLTVAPGCDSARTACVAQGDGLTIELLLGPPVQPLQPFDMRFQVVQGTLGDAARVELRFVMRDMDMGLNRYRLAYAPDGVWLGQATLPMCTSRRTDWIAQLEIRDGGRRWTAELPFSSE